MSETMTAVPKDDPLMIAWEAYVATPDYANSFKWAGMAEHRKGSMWAAFVAGFLARQPDVKYAGEITNLLRQARDIIAINESVNYDWFVSEINDALAKNPATAIPGTQPAECARYMPGTSGEPDGGAPIAALTEERYIVVSGESPRDVVVDAVDCDPCGLEEAVARAVFGSVEDGKASPQELKQLVEELLEREEVSFEDGFLRLYRGQVRQVAPRVEDNTGMEAALLEDVGRLRQKIHVMGKALKHQRTALMIVRDRQSGTARVEDINQGIAQIDAALSYVPPENGTPEEGR